MRETKHFFVFLSWPFVIFSPINLFHTWPSMSTKKESNQKKSYKAITVSHYSISYTLDKMLTHHSAEPDLY